MTTNILFKDRSPSWFYTWYIMGIAGIFLEIIFLKYFPFLIGYGIMGSLFGFTGKWLESKNILYKILATIFFWIIGFIFSFYVNKI